LPQVVSPRAKSKDGKQIGLLQISRVGSLCYHTAHLHLLREEALKRQRTLTPQALSSGTLQVPGLHIYSASQPPSAQYYPLPLFQPGTWPAQISTKRQWSLPLQATACQAAGFPALHPSELLTAFSVSGTAGRAETACRLLGHLSFWAVLGCPALRGPANSSSGPGENTGQGRKVECSPSRSTDVHAPADLYQADC